MGAICVGGEEVRVVEPGPDAGVLGAERLVDDRAARARSPTRTRSAGCACAGSSASSFSSFSPLRAPGREVGLEHVVALEADHLDVVEEQPEERRELVGLEQVHVEGVLEVGRPVRRDHERGAVVGAHAGELGGVVLRHHEVLDDVRRAHRVEASRRGTRARRRPSPRTRRRCPRPAGTEVGRARAAAVAGS